MFGSLRNVILGAAASLLLLMIGACGLIVHEHDDSALVYFIMLMAGLLISVRMFYESIIEPKLRK